MGLHSITSLSTTLFTIFTILILNLALLVQATPHPSKASISHVRHVDDLNAKEPITISTITITATESTPSNTPASSSAPSFLNPALFTSTLLNSTNFYRAQHNASAVIYNDTLSLFASHYLDKLGLPSSPSSAKSKSTTKCELTHSQGPYGENLALGCSDVQSCVEMWGDERDKYDFGRAEFDEDTGHFTQLVWKGTTDVGCAARWCRGWNSGRGGWYLVCEYWPRGNVVGEFGSMVQRRVRGNGGGRLGVGWRVMMVGVMVGGWLVFG
ncbi:CAP domain-containing protein [Neurospora intermedia]|uniref:CAP domain-containing protein n=1 Tax=Neurospora intermedia TaxID=5142 RepID=A0ABR3DA85_NEUIN